jgi:hypothetical protein
MTDTREYSEESDRTDHALEAGEIKGSSAMTDTSGGLGGEASTALGGGSGLGPVGTDANRPDDADQSAADAAAEVAGADEERMGEHPNP